MLMIIVLHFQGKTQLLNSSEAFSVLWFEKWIIQALCVCSVNCYVLITGYFIADSTFKAKKVLQMWLKVLLIGIICFIVYSAFSRSISIEAFLLSILPISTREYWFVTVYIGVYMLSPFLVNFMNHITQRQHLCFVRVLIIMFSFLPSLIPYGDSVIGFNGINGTNILWFICLICIASYVKKYGIREMARWKYAGLYFVSCFCMFLTKLTFTFTEQCWGVAGFLSTHWYNYSSIFCLGSAFTLFMFFMTKKEENYNTLGNRISLISKRTFGVYLVHENPLVRAAIWPIVLGMVGDLINGITYVPIVLCVVICIFSLSAVVDWFFDLCFSGVIEKLSNLLLSPMNKLWKGVHEGE